MRSKCSFAVFLLLAVAITAAACTGTDPETSQAIAETESTTPSDEPATSGSTQADDKPAAEQPEPAGSAESVLFASIVDAARAHTQARIDAVWATFEAATLDTGREAALRGPTVEALGEVSAALSQYADELDGLDVPERFEAERDRHTAEIRRAVGLMNFARAAASTGDEAHFIEVQDEADAIFVALASELSAEYADAAFVSPVDSGYSFTTAFGDLVAAELAYLEGVNAALREFDRRNATFGRVIGRAYTSEEALLTALYEAGAGDAFAAVRSVAETLVPPPALEDSHTRWLGQLEEQVALDEAIGRAARDGDAAAFVAANLKLGLTTVDDAATLHPAFFGIAIARRVSLGGGLEKRLGEAIGPYEAGLFDALLELTLKDPVGTLFPAFEVPASESTLARGVGLAGPDLVAALESIRATVNSLDPPADQATTHATVVQHLDDLQTILGRVLAAAAEGSLATMRVELSAATGAYCDARAALAGTESVTDIYFEARPGLCTG